ncbi:MAG: hypothetical protein KDB22_11385 [Planctomycetales bacterium]|nr:hypothetical protein [Planctomycetales bacterium]
MSERKQAAQRGHQDAARPNVEERRPRPNSRWICGYQPLGMACTEGPDDHGNCCQSGKRKQRSDHEISSCDQQCNCASDCELAKLRKTALGQTWDNMGPCIPLRTPWFSRQTLALNAAILTGGLLLLCMALPTKESVFVPGGLSAKHSQILGNVLVSERCSLCHPTSHSELAGYSQDDLCMVCHQSHMPAASLRSPHDLSAQQLQQLGQADQSLRFVALSPTSSSASSEQTACAQCHVEHHGTSNQLKKMGDARCQSCHQRQFHSFADGHPQFDDFPYRTSRRLNFDHGKHATKYFGQKNEEFDCHSCHVDRMQRSAVGPVFRALGFEQACARCHQDSIQSASTNGWALIQLPSIESTDATDPNLGLAAWPTGAQYGYEGQITLPMRLLLAADTKLYDVLQQLPENGQISEMPTAAERADAAQQISAGVKRLLDEVASEGQAAWRKRLVLIANKQLHRQLNSHEQLLVDELCRGLPPDLFRALQVRWFKSPSDLVANPAGGLLPNSDRATRITLVGDQDLLLDEGSLEYSGSDLLSDSTANNTSIPNADLLLTDQLGRLQLSPEDSVKVLSGISDALVGIDDWSDENYLPSSQPGSTGMPLPDNDSLLLGDSPGESSLTSDDDFGSSELLGTDDDFQGIGLLPSDTPKKLVKLRGSDHVVLGGWYLDDELYTIRYMPRGHADPMLAAWREFADILQQAAAPQTQSLLPHGVFQSDSSLKNCSECHAAATDGYARELWSNWKAVQRPAGDKPFTKFNHQPHLTLPAVQDCRYCHQLNNQEHATEFSQSPQLISHVDTGRSPSDHASVENDRWHGDEFMSIRIEQCSACHRSGSASSNCTTCHNYHVGSNSLSLSKPSSPNSNATGFQAFRDNKQLR